MRFLRLVAAGAALTLAAAAPAIAQGPPQGGPGGRGARMMEMMFKGIDLDAGQKAKVDSVMAAYRAQMPAFTPGQRPSDEDRAKRRELMEKETADIRGLLKPEQQKTFDDNVKEMREQMGRRRPQ